MEKRSSPPPEFRNGYVRPDPQNPADEQIAVIKASGPVSGKTGRLFIEDGKRLEKRELVLRTIREAELLVVSELHRLGVSRADLAEVLREVEKKGAIILEAESGRRSDAPAQFFEAILAFLDYYEVRRLSRAAARKAGKAGAETRWEGHAPPKPFATIQAIWNDHLQYPSIAAAMTAINKGVRRKDQVKDPSTIYKWARDGKLKLEPRPAGRPRKS